MFSGFFFLFFSATVRDKTVISECRFHSFSPLVPTKKMRHYMISMTYGLKSGLVAGGLDKAEQPAFASGTTGALPL